MRVSDGSGIRDPRTEIVRIETVRTEHIQGVLRHARWSGKCHSMVGIRDDVVLNGFIMVVYHWLERAISIYIYIYIYIRI